MGFMRRASFATAAAIMTLVSVTTSPTAAFAWSEADVVDTFYYYSDPEKTNLVDSVTETCTDYGVVITQPYEATPYYDQVPQYVCTSSGPYIPPDWPY